MNKKLKIYNINDLMKDSYNINETHIKILTELRRVNYLDVKQIAKNLKKDRTTIQKYLPQLMALQLVDNMQENLSPSGYKFVYFIINHEMVLQNLKSKITDHINSLNVGIDSMRLSQ